MNLRGKFAFSIGFLGLLCLMLPGSARADLVGTTVTGSLDFDADGLNFYNPAMGFVPAGYQNSAGAQDSNTVVIVGGNEFGFSDGLNTDVTSFSSTGFHFYGHKYHRRSKSQHHSYVDGPRLYGRVLDF
jgi:hypothetical protein